MEKNITAIIGDSYTLGLSVGGSRGAIDFSAPGVSLDATVMDPTGRRVLGRFEIIPVDLARGKFRIHMPSVGYVLRGTNIWAVRYTSANNTKTLVGGKFNGIVGPQND